MAYWRLANLPQKVLYHCLAKTQKESSWEIIEKHEVDFGGGVPLLGGRVLW